MPFDTESRSAHAITIEVLYEARMMLRIEVSKARRKDGGHTASLYHFEAAAETVAASRGQRRDAEYRSQYISAVRRRRAPLPA